MNDTSVYQSVRQSPAMEIAKTNIYSGIGSVHDTKAKYTRHFFYVGRRYGTR